MKIKKLLIVVLLTIGCLFLGGCSEEKMNIDYLLSIDQMKVSKQEVEMIINELDSPVKNNLIQQYKISLNDFDWNEKYGNKIAYEYLNEQLLNKIKEIKIIQKIAIDAKIYDDFNYEIFLEMLSEENKIREDKISKGKVVYGLKKFNEEQYYDYLNNNLNLQVRTYLRDKNIIKVTDKEIKQTYKENKKYFDGAELEDVKKSVEHMAFEKKCDEYIKEKMKGVEVAGDQKVLEDVVKEFIDLN